MIINTLTKTTYPGWGNYPAYHIQCMDEFATLNRWMNENDMKPFLLESGGNGYIFQVRNNGILFELTWF